MNQLRDEIFEQPAALQRVLSESRAQVREVARAVAEQPPVAVMIAARGSSDHAATYARYLLEAYTRLPVSLAAPSLYTLYRRPPDLSRCLVVGISQSGQSPDVVEVVAEGRRQGALTVAICNDPDSPLAREAALLIEQQAGLERSVAATKTYTTQLIAIAMLAAEMSGDAALASGLERLPAAVERALLLEGQAAEAAGCLAGHPNCLTLARGFNYATALELALKLKEAAYLFAAPYSAADFMHGPVALAEPDLPAAVIGALGPAEEGLRELALRLRESRARLVSISDDPALLDLACAPEAALSLSEALEGVPEPLSPIVCIVPGQLLTLHLARGRDDDDQEGPRGLSKVTLTK